MEKNKTIKKLVSNSLWSKQENVLIFSYSEEFIKKFTYIANKQFASSVYFLKNLDSFLLQLYFEKYQVIYLDVDLIFHKLDKILTEIKEGKNKNTKTYIAASKANFSKLKKFDLPKNVILRFLDGDEILDSEGKKYIY